MARPSRLKGHVEAQYPLTSTALREITLTAAGYDPEAVGEFMRRATRKLIEQLDAQTSKPIVKNGRVVDVFTTNDNASQIAAASQLIDLGIDVMGLKRRADVERQDQPAVTIDLSGWTVQPTPTNGHTPPSTDVTPDNGETP